MFCVYAKIRHMRKYLRSYDNLARAGAQAFIKQVSFRDRMLICCTNEERHDCSAIGGTTSRERFLHLLGNQLKVLIRLRYNWMYANAPR